MYGSIEMGEKGNSMEKWKERQKKMDTKQNKIRLERIATAAMQGIVSDAGTVAKMMMSVGHNDDAHYQLTAKVSLGYARALIAELDKGEG